MTISLSWHLVEPGKGHYLPGTSSDWNVFQDTFGDRTLTAADIRILEAMHRATHRDESFWGALAEALRNLPEEAEIDVRGEY